MIGYSEFRTNPPGGLIANRYTTRAYIVNIDGTGLRKLADRQGYIGVVPKIYVYNFHGRSSDVPIWSKDGK